MSDLTSVNGIAAANIAGLNGIAVANIAGLNGLFTWPSGGPDPMPDSCLGFADSYRINATDLAAIEFGLCAECDEDAGAGWNGVFEADVWGSVCNEDENAAYMTWYLGGTGTALDGHNVYAYSNINYYYDKNYPEYSSYYLFLACYDTSEEQEYGCWEGIKYDGADPTGVYDFDYNECGGTQPETLTVEADT
jgi:hypothetical protein